MKKFISKQSLAVAALLFSSTGFAATVTVTPSATIVAPGQTFSLTVSGTGFPDTVGATLKLFFNSNVSVVTPTLTAGIVLAAGTPFTGGIVAPSPFLSGNILSVLAPTVGTLPNGSFNAFVINMIANATSPGDAGIILFDDQSDFSWTDAGTFGAIQVDYTQASVSTVVPAPAALWLLGTGVVALAGRRLSRKTA
jgi:hypothetical protein